MMSSHLNPDEMTADQRREEIVAILARGYLRLQSSNGASKEADISAVNRDEDLEAVPDKSVYALQMESQS